MSMRIARTLAFFSVGITICAWLSSAAQAAEARQSASVASALHSRIDSLSAALSRPAERDALKAFYADRDFRPVWVDESGPTRAAVALIAELAAAGDWGLDPAHYRLDAVLTPLRDGRWTTEQTAAAEYFQPRSSTTPAKPVAAALPSRIAYCPLIWTAAQALQIQLRSCRRSPRQPIRMPR